MPQCAGVRYQWVFPHRGEALRRVEGGWCAPVLHFVVAQQSPFMT